MEFLEGNRLRLQVHLEGSSLYLARLEPYRLSDLQRLLEEVRHHPLVEITPIGQTVEGRPLELVRVGRPDAPYRVLLRARAHAWEPGGNWVAQGLIRALLSDDEVASRCLQRYCLYLLPMANQDGVARGRTRFNSLGKDLNRDWDHPADEHLAPENHALETWIKQRVAAGLRPHFAMDLHNDESGGLHLSRPPIEGLAGYLERMKRFEQLLRKHTWFTEGSSGATVRNPGTLGEGLLERYGIDACILEFNCNWIAGLKQYPSGEAWEQFGRGLREVFYEYFGKSDSAGDPSSASPVSRHSRHRNGIPIGSNSRGRGSVSIRRDSANVQPIITGSYEHRNLSRSRFPPLALAMMLGLGALAPSTAAPPVPAHPVNAWVKQTPLATTPVSPRLGYEGACVWDTRHQVLIRYGGHNQGGGGEQGAEVWTFDLQTTRWELQEPNLSPPGVCCNAQNLFDTARGRYLRFPFFSGNHGWQWWRELYLNDASVWTYDLTSNTWRNLRPLPAPRLAGLRGASWDSDEEVAVVFGGEGSQEGTLLYDPHANEWRWPKPSPQPAFRSGGQMAYDAAHKVHVLFGSQFSDDPHTWLYDVNKNQWRDAQPPLLPPTKENDAVLTYDPIHQVVLAVVEITEGEDEAARHRLETWAYDTEANRWTPRHPEPEPEPSGNRARQLLFAPELNLAILENCPSRPREQQIWTYRFAAAKPEEPLAPPPSRKPDRPRFVENAVVSVLSPTRVELTWLAPDDPSVTGYLLERAAVEVLTEDQLKRLKRNTPPLPEPSVGAFRRIGPFQRLTTKPVKATTFTDTAVDLTQPPRIEDEPLYERSFNTEQYDAEGEPYRFAVYAYRIRAVNAAGAESGPSPAFFTIPSPPQWVFSRESGTTCHLRWAPNPERGLQGYRVYRMDNRWDKDPISRLTSEPLPSTAYADPAAGQGTRRYYIVAVDALGQEGFPSSPVWFQREWRQYYEPFVGEWHQ